MGHIPRAGGWRIALSVSGVREMGNAHHNKAALRAWEEWPRLPRSAWVNLVRLGWNEGRRACLVKTKRPDRRAGLGGPCQSVRGEAKRIFEGYGRHSRTGHMPGDRGNHALRWLAEIGEVVRRVERGFEREQREDQNEGQRRDATNSAPAKCGKKGG